MVRSFTLGPDCTEISPVRSGPSPTVRSGQSNDEVLEGGEVLKPCYDEGVECSS